MKKINKTALIVLMSCMLAGISSQAGFSKANDSAQDLFKEANIFFKNEQYDQAISIYSAILDLDIEGGNLYYNLGNAYYKSGQLGKAILFYEKARQLIPRDSDLKANYIFANSLRQNPILPKKVLWINRVAKKIASNFSANELTLFFSIMFFVMTALIIKDIIFENSIMGRHNIAVLVILVSILCIWSVKIYDIELNQNAIIIADGVESRFAPSENAIVHFSPLHEKYRLFTRKRTIYVQQTSPVK